LAKKDVLGVVIDWTPMWWRVHNSSIQVGVVYRGELTERREGAFEREEIGIKEGFDR